MLTESQRAALTARLRRGRAAPADAIERRDPGASDLPLSFGQQQLWFIDRCAPGHAMYNIPLAIGLRGPLDAEALGRGIDDLVVRQEALRTRIVARPGGGPVQVIDPPGQVPVRVIDLSHDGEQQAVRLRGLIDAEAMAPFDLAAGPLLRVSLIRLADDDHVLLMVVHHVVFDGWSVGVLVREIAALYRQQASGEPSGLADLPVQFADYALWERDRLADPPSDLVGYWRQALGGFESVRFPAARPRPPVEEWSGSLAVRMTDQALLSDLRELGRRHGTTVFVTVMAGLVALLHRYTGQTDLVVGTVSANRRRPEVASLIGFLVNTLPIRADASGDPPFTELIARVSQATTSAYAHQDLPFSKIVDVLNVDRDPSRAPVFQIALTYAERDGEPMEAAGVQFSLTDLVAGINAAKFDLSLLAEARPGGLWFECSFKTALFDDDAMRRLLGHLEVLLRGAAANPAARLSELPVLTEAELRREFVEWNSPGSHYPRICVHQGFERQARSTPDAIAAEYQPDQTSAVQVSYGELNARANHIAGQLADLGVGPDCLVGICMTTSLTRLAALIGIWKAGGGYVPLDPKLPGDRLRYMIGDAGMRVIVVDQDCRQSLPETTARLLVLDDADRRLPDSPESGVTPANVAYVMYTSGSTGQPKGVMVEHRQAVNFLYSMIEPWRIGPDDSVLQVSAYTFDVSVMDTYMPLLAGAKVVLASDETLHTPRRLIALMRDRAITVVTTTPSIVALLGDADFPDLRMVLCCGEEMPSELAIKWRGRGPEFVNAYGPTETTVLSNFQALAPDAQLPPSFGLPMANYQVYVLDEHLKPVPPGVIGEVYVGGAGVARGYLNRPELTAARFIDNPFRPGSGRLYKSGDLCYRRADGTIVFAGRADHQVKIRGLRIELGEIEARLTSHPGIDQAVVMVTTNRAGDKDLTGYVRPSSGPADMGEPTPAELRSHLAAALPGYMIPNHLVYLAEFPLTSNGKIDRRALPAPDFAGAAGDRAEADSEPPATETERTLTELFAAVLHHPGIGPADNFFDCGGNSLQAIRLIDLIADRTRADLTPSAVFLNPTPRRLAAAIDAGAATAADGRPTAATDLVRLTSAEGRPPLILIHAIGGTVFDYAKLAELTGSCVVHGLQAPGLADPDATPATFADLVDRYAKTIKNTFPHGHYRLGGWSMGGVIAYEVARVLEHEGADVGMLVLLDAPFAIPADRATSEDALASQFLVDAVQSMGLAGAAVLPDPATTNAKDQLAWLADHLAKDASSHGPGAATLMARLANRFDVFRAHAMMIAGYHPDPSPATQAPTLIVSADRSPNAGTRTQWPQVLAGQVTTLTVDGDHYTFLNPPVVAQVAASIDEMIRQDRPGPTGASQYR